MASRRQRRPLVGFVLALSALTGLLLTTMAPVAAAPGQVSGVVFRDFDGDGVRDTAPSAGVQNDVPIAGVGVRAYDPLNNLVGSATTTSAGAYTIDTSSVTDGTALRLEFDDTQQPPPNQLPGDYQSSFAGANNGTSVRFATAGQTAPVDFMVLEPEDYGDPNAPILTGIQYAGVRGNANASGLPAVVANPWNVPQNSTNGTFPGRVSLATYGRVGSVWGVAFDRPQNAAYAAASYKRISDLGPLGLGGIYRISNVLNPDTGALNDPATGPVTDFLDVTTLGVDVGTVPTDRGLGAPDTPTRDTDAYQNSAKVGIGGIATSEDGNILFFTNLADRNVYALDVTGGATPTTATQVPLGLAGDERPWAVSVHRDRLYVGYVNTGEGVGPGLAAGAANLRFYVKSTTLALAQAGTPTWTQNLSAPLGYAKGNNITGWPCGAGGCPAHTRRWNTWTDQWTWPAPNAGSVGFPGYSPTHMYPQALVGSIAFDTQGRMVVGLVDRGSVQGGNRQLGTDPTDNQFYESVSSGDVLIAAPPAAPPAPPTGVFSLESNGVVGGAAGVNAGNNEGPGGGEFFNDRQNNGTGANHWENTLGAVVTYPGVQQVASTSMDPLNQIRVTGLSWFSLGNGAVQRGYNQTRDPLTAVGLGDPEVGPEAPGSTRASEAGGAYFQKGGGLGAVALLTREAPVEIGNRVWLDADFNGRQDADEPNIQGAPVQLFAADDAGNPTGAELASTETDAAGTYYFRSDEIDGFNPGGSYVVVFARGPPSAAVTFTGPNAGHVGFAGITWDDLDFATQTSTGDQVQRDSNADAETPEAPTGNAPVTVGPPGHNDHTIDAGFNTTGTFAIQKLVDPEGGEALPDQTFTFDVTAATDFRGTNVLPTIDPDSFTVSAGETATYPGVLPVGTSITIAERDADQFDEVTYDPSPTQVITVNDNEATTFVVTDLLPLPGSFTVEKLLSGDPDAVAAAEDTEFEVAWETEGDPSQTGTITLTGGEVSDPVELPAGTVVNLTEVTPTELPPGVAWNGYTWQPAEGVTISEDGTTATITIGADQSIALSIENELQLLPGEFTVEKLLTGDPDAVAAAEDTEFEVAWETEGDPSQTGTITLTGGEVSDPVELPAGTVVNLTEVTPTELPPGVAWNGYTWQPAEGVTISEDGTTATITIGADQSIALSIENELQLLPGEFTVEKLLTGDPDAVAAAEDTEFEVAWETEGDPSQTGTITLTGGEVSDPVELPAGTVVTLTEVTPTELPPGVAWNGYTWQPAEGVTISEDGQTATITIGPDQTIALSIENELTVPPVPPTPAPTAEPATAAPDLPEDLADTGSGATWLMLLMLGILALGVGLALVLSARSRRET